MNQLKEEIISDIYNDASKGISEKVEQYLSEYPYDVDILMIKGYLKLMENQTDEAITILRFCYKKNPFDVDNYYLLSIGYINSGQSIKALNLLNRAIYIYEFYKEKHNVKYMFFNETVCYSLIKELVDAIVLKGESAQGQQLTKMQKELASYNFKSNKEFWLFDDLIKRKETVIGEKIWLDSDDVRYCGYYNSCCLTFEDIHTSNLIDNKGEILPVLYEGDTFHLQLEKEAILPIANNEGGIVQITMNHEPTVSLNHWIPKHFNYYKVKGEVSISSNNKMIVSNPILLGHAKNRKRIVISLFVDGLSQQIIDEVGLSNLMPHTSHFFEKGVQFNNAFTTSDWTYPSIASYVTGLEVQNHMMVNPDVAIGLPEDSETIFEHMKKAGYYTAMFTGDWRSTIVEGYGKGLDRYVVQHQNIGMRTEDAIIAVMEHIRGFIDTDQYLWLTVGDLHDVADDYALPLSIQTHMSLAERQMEERGETSVKQNYSLRKRQKYIQYAKKIDEDLHILYDFLEKQFKDEDIVVTLFSDHGQTYLTKPEEHHLSRSHSNVAFMVRDNRYLGESEEYISAVDYPAILCKLANVPYEPKESAGKLPKVFGGEKPHEFVVSETIHRGDYYMAALRNSSYTFYFTSEHKVDEYSRLQWGEHYSARLETAEGDLIMDKEKELGYVEWIKHHLRYIIRY